MTKDVPLFCLKHIRRCFASNSRWPEVINFCLFCAEIVFFRIWEKDIKIWIKKMMGQDEAEVVGGVGRVRSTTAEDIFKANVDAKGEDKKGEKFVKNHSATDHIPETLFAQIRCFEFMFVFLLLLVRIFDQSNLARLKFQSDGQSIIWLWNRAFFVKWSNIMRLNFRFFWMNDHFEWENT